MMGPGAALAVRCIGIWAGQAIRKLSVVATAAGITVALKGWDFAKKVFEFAAIDQVYTWIKGEIQSSPEQKVIIIHVVKQAAQTGAAKLI